VNVLLAKGFEEYKHEKLHYIFVLGIQMHHEQFLLQLVLDWQMDVQC
jgi:hypothetical protein